MRILDPQRRLLVFIFSCQNKKKLSKELLMFRRVIIAWYTPISFFNVENGFGRNSRKLELYNFICKIVWNQKDYMVLSFLHKTKAPYRQSLYTYKCTFTYTWNNINFFSNCPNSPTWEKVRRHKSYLSKSSLSTHQKQSRKVQLSEEKKVQLLRCYLRM